MSKKAKKASWRTLARRAKQMGPKEAKRLRAKSAAMRRDERKAKPKKAAPTTRRKIPAAAVRAVKAWATRRANAIKKAAAEGGLATGHTQSGGQQAYNAQTTTPGHGEIVGGADAQAAERIVKLARKKGGTDAVQNELAAMRLQAHYEGRMENDRGATNRMIEVQEIIANRIVCGFIAVVDERQRNGLPPGSCFTLDSHTVCRIVDALNKAGYRASGKT